MSGDPRYQFRCGSTDASGRGECPACRAMSLYRIKWWDSVGYVGGEIVEAGHGYRAICEACGYEARVDIDAPPQEGA